MSMEKYTSGLLTLITSRGGKNDKRERQRGRRQMEVKARRGGSGW
jgi:hypothetical protein